MQQLRAVSTATNFKTRKNAIASTGTAWNVFRLRGGRWTAKSASPITAAYPSRRFGTESNENITQTAQEGKPPVGHQRWLKEEKLSYKSLPFPFCSQRKFLREESFQQVRLRSTESLALNERRQKDAADDTLSVSQFVPNFNVSFDDSRLSFSGKTTWEIIRALAVLRMCSFRFVTDHSLTMMATCRQLLGTRLTDWLLKKTVYGQFVSGETPDEIVSAVRKLRAVGVGPLLAIPMEDDIDSQHQDADRQFDNNLCSVLDSMNLAYHLQPGGFPMVQLKLTALMPGTLCAMVSKACPEPSSRPEVVEAVARALKGGQPLDVAQIFGSDIPAEMGDQLVKGLQRVAKVCELAVDKQVIVMVDAEYTYMNPALNLITLAMMLNCNTGIPRPPLVFYTYQNYLKATREVLERDVNFLESRGAGFAAKMVRGAYMNKERKSAAMSGLEDPVHDTYDATSAAYDSGVAMLLNKMAASPRGKYRMIVATHNEQSAILAVKRMEKLGIRPDEGSVFFGQLMGMADHITCSLGVNGFLACKSMPYGRVEDTLPYLSRRAQENKAVLEGSRKEHALLTTELRRRFRLGSPIK